MNIHFSDLALCRITALTSLALGPLGMIVSMLFLDSPLAAHVVAGASGFVASALLATGSLITLALLVHRPAVPMAPLC